MLRGQENRVSSTDLKLVILRSCFGFFVKKCDHFTIRCFSICSQCLHSVTNTKLPHADASTRLQCQARNGGKTQVARLLADWARKTVFYGKRIHSHLLQRNVSILHKYHYNLSLSEFSCSGRNILQLFTKVQANNAWKAESVQRFLLYACVRN